MIGEIGVANASVAKKIDKKANVVYAEIDVAEFAKIKNASIHYEAPSKFPAIEIDLSFLSETYAPIANAVKAANCALIKNVEVVDIYTDDNGKSITVRLYFSHAERTLTMDEVMEVVNGIIKDLEQTGIKLKVVPTV